MPAEELSGLESVSEPEDAELLTAFHAGDLEAASRLYERYARRLYVLAKARTPAPLAGRLDPDDIVQSVFRSFFRSARAGAFGVPTGVDLWPLLLTIALNKIRAQGAFHTAAKRDVRKTEPLGGEDAVAKAVSQLESRDPQPFLHSFAWELLERLPEHLREVVRLRIEGHHVAEIAVKLGRTKRSIERLLQECRQRLTLALEEHLSDG